MVFPLWLAANSTVSFPTADPLNTTGSARLYSPVIHEIEQINQTKIPGEYMRVRQLCSDALWSVALPSAWQAPPLSKVGLAPTRSGVQNPTH